MKQCWGGVLACMALLGLLWSLGLQARDLQPKCCECNPAVTWQRESHSLFPCQNGWLSQTSARTRAGPQESFFTPDVFFCVEDLNPVGPPWLEYRGPPGIYRSPWANLWLPVTMVAMAALIDRVKYASHPNFRRFLA